MQCQEIKVWMPLHLVTDPLFFINTDKALAIISGILLSVVLHLYAVPGPVSLPPVVWLLASHSIENPSQCEITYIKKHNRNYINQQAPISIKNITSWQYDTYTDLIFLVCFLHCYCTDQCRLYRKITTVSAVSKVNYNDIKNTYSHYCFCRVNDMFGLCSTAWAAGNRIWLTGELYMCAR